jgi:hypothetical protein
MSFYEKRMPHSSSSTASPKKKRRKYSVDNGGGGSDNGHFLSAHEQHSTSTYLSGGGSHSNSLRTFTLIDRIVDIAKYKNNQSIYTMCRDWMNSSNILSKEKMLAANKTSPAIDETDEEKSAAEGKTDSYFIYSLPDKSTEDTDDQSAQGEGRGGGAGGEDPVVKLNQSIKETIRCTEHDDLELIQSLNLDDDQCVKSHALLKLHVNRWKLARKEWMGFYRTSNRPYKKTTDVLRSIFEEI